MLGTEGIIQAQSWKTEIKGNIQPFTLATPTQSSLSQKNQTNKHIHSFSPLSVSFSACLFLFISLSLSLTHTHSLSLSLCRLVGLVVKASVSRVAEPGFKSHLCQDFSGSSRNSDLKIGTPVATLPDAWHHRVSAGTSWP